VIRDALTAGHGEVEVAAWVDDWGADWIEAADEGETRAFVTVSDDGGETGLSVWLPDGLPARVPSVADIVQDAIVGARGDPFPACPAHPNHPMWVRFEDGMAWPEWQCPSGAGAVRVGDLSVTSQ
jgi:hypothetical protein